MDGTSGTGKPQHLQLTGFHGSDLPGAMKRLSSGFPRPQQPGSVLSLDRFKPQCVRGVMPPTSGLREIRSKALEPAELGWRPSETRISY